MRYDLQPSYKVLCELLRFFEDTALAFRRFSDRRLERGATNNKKLSWKLVRL